MAGRERAMAENRRGMNVAGPGAGRMRPRWCVASRRRAQDGIHRRPRTAYPTTPRSRVQQPVAGVALRTPAQAIARATPTTPERISGYMELSTYR
jgi:hypothetical protein